MTFLGSSPGGLRECETSKSQQRQAFSLARVPPPANQRAPSRPACPSPPPRPWPIGCRDSAWSRRAMPERQLEAGLVEECARGWGRGSSHHFLPRLPSPAPTVQPESKHPASASQERSGEMMHLFRRGGPRGGEGGSSGWRRSTSRASATRLTTQQGNTPERVVSGGSTYIFHKGPEGKSCGIYGRAAGSLPQLHFRSNRPTAVCLSERYYC